MDVRPVRRPGAPRSQLLEQPEAVRELPHLHGRSVLEVDQGQPLAAGLDVGRWNTHQFALVGARDGEPERHAVAVDDRFDHLDGHVRHRRPVLADQLLVGLPAVDVPRGARVLAHEVLGQDFVDHVELPATPGFLRDASGDRDVLLARVGVCGSHSYTGGRIQLPAGKP